MLLNGSFRGQGILRGLFLFPYVAPVIAVAFVWAFFLDPFSGTVNALGQRWDLLAGPVNFLGQRSIDVSLRPHVRSRWRSRPSSCSAPGTTSPSRSCSSWRACRRCRWTCTRPPTSTAPGPFAKFWYITLPNLAGILAVLFLLRFMFLINKFEDIFLLTGGAAGTKNLPVLVYDEAFARSDIGAGRRSP
jgi:multiple sugar transport system permease protein